MRKWPLAIALAVLILAATVIAAAETVSRFNMSYIYFGSTATYIENVDRTEGSLDLISPTYFDIGTDGNLILSDKIDRSFIETMQERGIKVVPFLSNHWNREAGRAALRNMEALADQVAEAIDEFDMDGVNVDIENLTEIDRNDYVEFVRILRDRLSDDKEISVAVAANPTGKTTGWQGSYDYKALARYSDYLVIMAYDETSEGEKAGPVASTSFVEKSIQYAVERVSPRKIVLGIPFYGRYWKAGQSYGGYGIHLSKVDELLNNYSSTVTFDTYFGVPKATVTIRPQDNPPYIFGKQLSPGNYTIWYENDLSIKYKLRLVQKYDLMGTASWSLGQETADTWDYYGLWLNGNWFVDTLGHWSQEAVASMEDKGWMKGVSSTHFAPDQTLTRAQAAAILRRALDLDSDDPEAHDVFKDVGTYHWAYDDILAVSQNGIMQGTGGNRFSPDDPLTREQMAVMLDRIFGADEEENAENPFKDVKPDMWSYDAITRMYNSGIFEGFEDDTFRPASVITRAQMAATMDRISSRFTM